MSFFCSRPRAAAIGLVACFVILHPARAADPEPAPIRIGLNADLSAFAAVGGEAIRRGMVIAIDEINRTGGILGRPLDLVIRDHRGNPDRAIDYILDFAAMEDLVAVMGGTLTPIAMAELEAVHEHGLLYLGPWAAGTFIVDNGYDPNFVFRVSVRDEYAGDYLIAAALAKGYQRPAFLLWQTAWGRSNELAMKAALDVRGREPVAIEWFSTGTKSVADQIETIRLAGADVVMLIAAPAGAVTVVRDMAVLPPAKRLPIIAHWGVAAGDFHRRAADDLDDVDLRFLQTFSFFDPPFPDRAERVLAGYCKLFGDCDGPASVLAPTGTAHAYDLVHLLARAIEQAGTIDRAEVRQAMEALERHDGLVRLYQPPFLPDRHDALGPEDFRLAVYDDDGVIVPLNLP